MDKKFNSMSFCKDNYKKYYPSLGREEVDDSAMWEDVASFIRIAVQNRLQMKIWSDDFTTVIEYNYQDEELGNVSLEWLGPDEYVESAVADGTGEGER